MHPARCIRILVCGSIRRLGSHDRFLSRLESPEPLNGIIGPAQRSKQERVSSIRMLKDEALLACIPILQGPV